MDLNVKVISFLKKRYPHSLFTVTLGENQETVHKKIASFKKGSPSWFSRFDNQQST